MAVLSLPLTFQNSFWSQNYRKGLEVLYAQLEKGVLEDEEIIAFIRVRRAFSHDEGASLHVAFRGLKEESIAQGKAHEAIAVELKDTVADPFEKWALGYKDRLKGSKQTMLDGWMLAYEMAHTDVAKLKNDYLTKIRKADEAEDDARFAPIPPPVGDKYTTSPSLQPRDRRDVPTRTATVSERITQRFKEFRLGASTGAQEKSEVHFDADVEEKGTPKLDKGKGRALDVASPPRIASPPPMSPPLPPARMSGTPPTRINTNPSPPQPAPPIMVAGLTYTPAELSALFKRAKSELPLRAVRFPLIGEYQDVFSGEDFATWLKEKVEDFGGNLDRAAFAARELTEKHNLLRRLGELGNDYVNASDVFYQIRPKKSLSPLAENVAKGTSTFASLVSKALNTNNAEPAHIRARREAEAADREYRISIRKLDRQRLALEERIEDTLKTLQKWELDRLRAVKTVLRQYQDAVSKLAKANEPSFDRSAVLIDSYHPEADLKVFIERHRTGPFRPEPQVYESVSHDESDVVFGIDLRRWVDSGIWHGASPDEKRDDIPPVLTVMLAALNEAYDKLPNDVEKRKTWIYDVPLPAVHHLRETLNAVPTEQPLPNDILAKYDAPVLAGAIKLWALELDPPLGMYESWDELRKLYPTVGSGAKAEAHPSEEQHIQDVQGALQRLPRVHLLVLDTIVKHLKSLIASTSTAENEESNEIYVNKLSLAVGRAVIRPKQENEISIQDRHPTLLFMDLLNKYEEILPPTLEKKKRESQRKMPVRRRTRPVDMRMSRSRISAGADLRELQQQEFEQRTGLKLSKASPPLPNAPAPSGAAELPAIPGSSNPPTADSEQPQPTAVHAEPEDLPSIPPGPPPPAPGDIYIQVKRSLPQIPPPPPLDAPAAPAVPSPSMQAAGAPPMFKEPPPETDDLPPRPMFKEPEPEVESPVGSMPMPAFAPPPPEPASPPTRSPAFREPPPEREDTISPPPPHAHIPLALRPGSSRPASPRVPAQSSRSPSPTKPITPSPTTPSMTDVNRLRGPRLARGPRVSGSSVSSMVSSLNRQSTGGSRPGSPGVNGGGATGLSRNSSRTYGGGHAKRGSISRVSEFSRRTMASDAEDEVVDK
ncbi:hypothetical protein POSPLADRAFT_1065539 [Postia placenta MAD-698-R-SB12]|uniref:Rho-GAP domain-containing protein n=1 Tax=Postia placenta MAD-698-R-SB12 TaxID=670580 RepID=A0A1X6N6R8_9APHY|nr:hypothetical protein POSPLADRAFT_1065539 [Postia placenta MAD-698-R-SB12]OSX64294.1 hypothetical protein POSPLADRAFT_1065539 [Postia placenta MAD-698-R-SB12]